MQFGGVAGTPIEPYADDRRVVVVEGKLDRHRVGVAIGRADVIERHRVHVRTLVEATTVRVQIPDLVERPLVPVLVVALLDPVDRDVRTRVDRVRHGIGSPAQRLHLPRRHPARAGEVVRADETSRDVVDALVPAVVRRLEPLVRVDESQEHRADLHRVVLDAEGFERIVGRQAHRISPSCVMTSPRTTLPVAVRGNGSSRMNHRDGTL